MSTGTGMKVRKKIATTAPSYQALCPLSGALSGRGGCPIMRKKSA